MSNKPIVVYWSDAVTNHNDPDWSLLYSNPTTLFKDHFKNKDKTSTSHFFMCPASANKMKKTLVFNSPMSFGYNYDFSNGKVEFSSNTKETLFAEVVRGNMLTTGPNFKIGMGYPFFASESLEVSFTSPFFHKTTYMQNCATVPGNFDIGQWYRPFSLEVQTWSEKGTINFIEGEPLFYAEFLTDRPIIVKRYMQTELLTKYMQSCINSTSMFGFGQTLKNRYDRFRSTSLRGKILSEINKNLIDEEPLKL